VTGAFVVVEGTDVGAAVGAVGVNDGDLVGSGVGCLVGDAVKS